MAHPAPAASRCTSEEFFELVARGMLAPDDRVELLEGVVVAMAPSNPPHAAAISRIMRALFEAIGRRAVIRVQSSFRAGRYSKPEPDVAVVPGSEPDSYTFKTGRVRHHFCPTCGCAPFGVGTDRKGEASAAINVRCLEGVDFSALKVVPFDGRSL